jgi:hypothetical protein
MASSVRFVDTTTQPAGGRPDLSSLLGRVLFSRHGTGDPQQVLRAMICSAISADYHPASVRHFVLGTPRAAYLVPLLTSSSSWHSIVASARSYLAAVNDADGGARTKRLPWARMGIARAVSPLPEGHGLSTRMEVRVRVTILLMAARALETGYDNLLATAGWLAQEMNVTGAQAARVLVVMEKKLNWIRRVRGSGMGIRYRFVALNTSELRKTSWRYNVTVDALANNEPDGDPLALLISLIRNPSWAYSEELGHRAWLRLAIPLMPTAENRLGLSPASYRKLGKALDAELPGALAGDIDLRAALDEFAESSLAVFIHEDRGVDLRAAAAENLARLHTVRDAKNEKFAAIKAAQQLLREVWNTVGRVPDASDPGHEIKRWVDEAAVYFAGNPVASEMLAPVHEQLQGILAQRGHDEVLTTRISAYMLPEAVSS